MGPIQEFFTGPIGTMIWNLLVALVILIIGYIVARILGSLTRRLLMRLKLDNRLVEWLSDPEHPRQFNVENIIASVVFWVVMLFVLVAFFERLNLTGLASPIQSFLNNFTTEYLPRLVAAGVLLFVAWLVAAALRFLVLKGGGLLKIDERLTKYAALKDEERVSFTDTLAVAVYWFTLLLFLPSVLNALGITQIAASFQVIFAQIFEYIPNVLAAFVIVLVGWFIARVVRQVVEGLLKAIGTDQAGQRIGLSEERSLSGIVGLILYISIFVVAIIAALDALAIPSITAPATEMLSTFVNVIPNLIGALVILVVAYYLGRLVANLIRDLLAGIGVDTLPEKLGLTWSGTTPLSQWIGYLILVAIMLFAVVSATEMLGSTALTEIINVFIGFFWKVVLGVVILAIGLYFANLAFGVTLAAIGLAAALSFGLGTQKIAERELDSFITKMREPKDD